MPTVPGCFSVLQAKWLSYWWTASRQSPDVPLPNNIFPPPPGRLGGVPKPDEIYNVSSVYSGSAPWSPSSWTCPENLRRNMHRRYSDQMPETPQLAPFEVKEQQLFSKLPPDVWDPYHMSKDAPCHPMEETHLVHCIHNLILLVTTQMTPLYNAIFTPCLHFCLYMWSTSFCLTYAHDLYQTVKQRLLSYHSSHVHQT